MRVLNWENSPWPRTPLPQAIPKTRAAAGSALPAHQTIPGRLGASLAPPPQVLPLLTRGPLEAQAIVGVVPVLAGPPVSAGLALALIDVDVAAVARVAGLAEAGEGGDAVLAGPIVARVGVALINVDLTVYTRETWSHWRHTVRMEHIGGQMDSAEVRMEDTGVMIRDAGS